MVDVTCEVVLEYCLLAWKKYILKLIKWKVEGLSCYPFYLFSARVKNLGGGLNWCNWRFFMT
jgi:hypothetical protein